MTIRAIVLAIAFLVPISAGAQQSADCVGIYDDNGTRVARASLEPIGGGSIGAYALFQDSGRLAVLEADQEALSGPSAVFFTGSSCNGDAYMRRTNRLQQRAYLAGSEVWYPDVAASPIEITADSNRVAGSGGCTGGATFLSDAVPAYTFMLPALTPPFHLEPEPCFTLPPSVAALGPRSLLAMTLLLAFGAVLVTRRRDVPVSVERD